VTRNRVYDGPVSSTHDYHRVLHAAWAKGGQDLQLPLAERLFSGYFEHQQDPGSRAWLAKEAVSAGVFSSIEEANEFFKSDTYDAEVKQGYLNARKMGINGVPFFVFEGKWAVSGAQPPAAFLDIFNELVKCGCGRTNGEEEAAPRETSGAVAPTQTAQNDGNVCGSEDSMVCG
jgi:predicted DsbA family dithiol-disulfide isomerase